MAETHELRLKINAAAAKSGSRDFVRAITAIKAAVRGLEKDSAGVFKRLAQRSKAASKSARVKIGGVDKSAIRSLDQFVKTQGRALRATANTQKGLASLAAGMRRASDAQLAASSSSTTLNKSLGATNTLLARQATLAIAAAEALRRTVGVTPSAGTAERGGGSRAARQSETTSEKAAANQMRVTRAIAESTLQAERLATSLAKVGAGTSIRDVGQALEKLRSSLNAAGGDTKKITNAQNEFKTSMAGISTRLVTLNAKLREEQAALKNAATASRNKAKASREAARASTELARSEEAASKATNRQASMQLATANAMRQVEQETARLSAKLRALGDTKGIETLNGAFGRFRTQANAGFQSMLQLRQGLGQFNAAAGKAKTNIIGLSSAQQNAARTAKTLARGERDATRQARALEREMRSVASASNVASRSFRNATGNLRGLENAFSLSFQAGSAFRSMIGGITLGVFTTSVFAAGNALDQFRVTMQVATDTAAEAKKQFDFIDDTARGLGVSLRGAREDFSKFAIASDIAGVSADTTRNIFSSVAQAMAVLGRSSEDQRLSFLALEQMMSKGVISSEELRRQLGERLPGAVNIMARAVGVSTGELQKMLKAGELISSEVLPKFADELNRIFGPGLEAAQKRAGFQLGVLRVEFEKFLEVSAQSGLMQQLSIEFRNLTNLMRSPSTARAAETLGVGLAKAAQTIATAAKFIVRNINEIKDVAVAVFTGILARQVLLFGNALLMMGQNVLAFAASFGGLSSAEAVNTAAVQQNTLAMAKQAEVMALANLQRAKAVQATGALTGATLVQTAQIEVNSAANAKAAATSAIAATRVGGLAKGFSVLSRGLLALAGPIGIAIAALTLLPSVFGDSEDAADSASVTYERALRRMQVANDTFLRSALDLDELDIQGKLLQSIEGFRAGRRVAESIQGDPQFEKDLERIGATLAAKASDAQIVDVQNLRDALEVLRTTTAVGKELEDQLQAARDAFFAVAGSGGARGLKKALLELDVVTRGLLQAQSLQAVTMKDVGLAAGEAGEAALVNAGAIETGTRITVTATNDLIGAITQLDAVMGFAAPEIIPKSTIDTVRELNLVTEFSREQLLELQASLLAVNDADISPVLLDNKNAVLALVRSLLEATPALASAEAQMGTMAKTAAGLIPKLTEMARVAAVLAEAFNTVDAANISIGKLGADLRTELELEIDIAGLTDPAEKASRTFFELTEDGKTFLTELETNVRTANEAFTEAFKGGTGGPALEGLREQVVLAEERRDSEIALTDEVVRRGAAEDAARKASKKGRGDLKRQIKALERLRDQSLTTEGALLKLDASAKLLASTLATTIIPLEKDRAAILKQLQFETAETIAKEGALGNAYVTTAEMIGKTVEEIEQLIATRILVNELTAQGTKELDAQAIALIKVFNERKRMETLEENRKEALGAQAEFIAGTQKEIDVLRLLNSGMVENKAIAEVVLDLKRAGIILTAEEINQMNLLSAELERATTLAGGPAKAWLDAVPDMIEAGQMLEAEVFGGLSDALAEFLQTGEFSLDSLLNSLQATSAKILADQAIKGLFDLLGSNGGEGDFFGFSSDIGVDSTEATKEGIQQAFSMGTLETVEGITTSFTTGSAETNTQVLTAFEQGGTTAADKLRQALANTPVTIDASGASGLGFGGGTTGGDGGTSGLAGDIGTSMTKAGSDAAKEIGTSITDSGGLFGDSLSGIFEGGASQFSSIFAGLGSALGGAIGGSTGSAIGGLIGTVLPLVLSAMFAEGGISNSPSAQNPISSVPAALFRNAPSFKGGTANTSGIPALLHDNEAVVPLTAGRKIPVEGGASAQQEFNISQSFIFPEGDVDSFRKSTNQIAADTAAVVNRAVKANS